MISSAVKVFSDEMKETKTIEKNEQKTKDNTFLNLLAQKIENRNEPVKAEHGNAPQKQEELVPAENKKEPGIGKKEIRNLEQAKEKVISDLGYFIDRLKDLLSPSGRNRSPKHNDLIKEKLVIDLGAFMEKLKGLDVFKTSSKDIKEARTQLNQQLRIKEIRDQEIFHKVILFFKTLKAGLQQAENLSRNHKTMVKDENAKPAENQKMLVDQSFLKNKKVEVQKVRSSVPEKETVFSSLLKNESQSQKNHLDTKNLLSASLENQSGRVNLSRKEDEIVSRRVDTNDLVNRIAEKIKITLNENKSEVVMNLKPEFLGKLTVKLELENNTISGRFIVDNIYAEKALKDGLAQLKVAFQNMGMEVSHFDVSMSNQHNPSATADHIGMESGASFGYEPKSSTVSEQAVTQIYDQNSWIARNVNITI